MKSQEMVDKYGQYALVTSYFIPVVRHIVPYLVGMNNMSFKTYALYSYTTGFVWTLVYFVLGSLFGQHIERIVAYCDRVWFVFSEYCIDCECVLFFTIKRRRRSPLLLIWLYLSKC